MPRTLPPGTWTVWVIAAVSLALLGVSGGNVAVALAPILAATLWTAAPSIARAPMPRLIQSFLALALLLDVPAARPFNELMPVSKLLGSFLFDTIAKWSGLSLSSPTLFELASYGLAGVGVWRAIGTRQGPGFSRVAWILAFMLPLAALLAVGVGLARGHDFGSALTQTRVLPLYAAWTLIGYSGLKAAEDVHGVLWAVTICAALKAAQGLYVYYGAYGGSLGLREYLIDHSSSDFMATAMLFPAALMALGIFPRGLPRAAILGGFLPVAMAYVINDRRSSFLGVILALVFTPLLLKDAARRRYLSVAAVVLAMALAGAGLLKALGGGSADSAAAHEHSLLSSVDHSADYRDLENFDLYGLVRDHQLLGFGFGARIPMLADLPDISFAYNLFDLLPHNTLLFIWGCAGPIGMAALASFAALGMAAGGRLLRRSAAPKLRIVGFIGFTMVIRWLVYTYADMGLLDGRLIALTAVMVGSMVGLLEKFSAGDTYEQISA